MNDSTKQFNKMNKEYGQFKQVQKEIAIFEMENRDNELLQQYIQLLAAREKLQKSISEKTDKDLLYEKMIQDDVDCYDGSNITVTLKRPYVKTTVDSKKFIEDNPIGSKLYNKYMKETVCKGNVILKIIEE